MKKRRLIPILIFIVLITVIFTGCKKEELISSYNEAELKVYTTIYPIQFIVQEIGSEVIEVNSVYPPGIDAHTFEPTTKDMTEIAMSDAFIYFGPTMEGFVASAAEALASEDVKLVSLEEYEELFTAPQMDGVTVSSDSPTRSIKPNHDENNRNPHVWLDPLRMMVMTEIITEQLIELAPEREKFFRENKHNLVVRFQKLEDSFNKMVADKANKYMIVPHAAYGYWEERYGIEQISISGLSPTEEPSQKYLTEIIETAEQLNINYLFYEQNTPDKLIEIIQKEIDAEAYTIHNLSVLTEEDIENEADYFTLMEQNINVLDDAFQ